MSDEALSNPVQLDLDLGRKLAAEGMDAAADHADRAKPAWSETAAFWLGDFLTRLAAGRRFAAEDVRLHAYKNGLPHPPDERAWGVVFRAAIRSNLIERVGFEPSRNAVAHARPAAVYIARDRP